MNSKASLSVSEFLPEFEDMVFFIPAKMSHTKCITYFELVIGAIKIKNSDCCGEQPTF